MGTMKKLIVEVVDAKNLSPKDGHGASSPYVQVDFYGQRKRTQTVISDLNPSWNEALEFNTGAHSDIFGDQIEIEIYHDKSYGPTRRNNFLGKVYLSSSQFANVRKGEEALQYFKLEKKYLLSWIQGDIGLKIYHVDEVVLPPAPPAPPSPPPSAAPPLPAKEEEAPPATAEAEESAPPATAETDQPEVEPPPPPPPAEEVKSVQPELQPDTAATPTSPPLPPPAPEMPRPPTPRPPTPRSPAPIRTGSRIPEVKASTVSSTITEVRLSSAGAPGIRPPPPLPPALTRTFSSASLDSAASSTVDRASFDLVDKMHYIFVRVVKARSLPTAGNPIVKIVVAGGSRVVTNPARRATAFFEWDQTFAFGRNDDVAAVLEISVWDLHDPEASHELLGGICFDVSEIPLRDPPDSPLAPQWYRLEGGGSQMGDIMLVTWLGTQADESFPDAWKTDTAGNVNSKAKVYLSPKLWYLRVTVLDAQDVTPSRESTFHVKAQLGFQVLKSKPIISRNGGPSFNEDLLFVVAEPFTDQLSFTLEHRSPKGPLPVGVVRVPLATIERRVDDRKVAAKWFNLEEPQKGGGAYKGRVQLRLCFDGGYHVMDEPAHVCSDYRPTAKQLWKPAVGMVELGIIGCRNLLPAKSVNGKGSTDAYVVAKYGPKWVRTRTVTDSLDPRWNEQYTWKVYDPCTVLTIGVFDSWQVAMEVDDDPTTRPDLRIGKVRIRISTLQTGRVYRNRYPLMLLTQAGLKKTGEIELAVRFLRNTPTLDVLQVYAQPLLPLMHHIRPLGVGQQELLRNAAAKILALHLSRSEPPLRRETVLYMLDADSHAFSMRKVRANWLRIISVIAGVIEMVRWIDDTRTWKNPTATILVHALLVMLVWFPDLIVPTLAFYVFAIGAWNYRFRARAMPPHLDPRLSLAESVDRDELDEEFDALPSGRAPEVVRARYDRLRTLGARVQTVLGDVATQGERVQALVTWQDPRATGIFVGLCFVVAMVLYLVPSKMVAMAAGFYYLRHPMFRDRAPPPALNFFRRLPSLSDRML